MSSSSVQPAGSISGSALHELEKAGDVVDEGVLARIDEYEEGLDDHARQRRSPRGEPGT